MQAVIYIERSGPILSTSCRAVQYVGMQQVDYNIILLCQLALNACVTQTAMRVMEANERRVSFTPLWPIVKNYFLKIYTIHSVKKEGSSKLTHERCHHHPILKRDDEGIIKRCAYMRCYVQLCHLFFIIIEDIHFHVITTSFFNCFFSFALEKCFSTFLSLNH